MVDAMATSHHLVDLTARVAKHTLTTEELARRWGIHPESLKRAVRNGSLPVRPIIPGSGRWVFSLAAVERAETETLAR
jgi:Helix-turn-helix domain